MMNKKIKLLPKKIQSVGMDVSNNTLGVVDTLRTIEKYDNDGYGDYTKEKDDNEEGKLSKSEILDMFKEEQ